MTTSDAALSAQLRYIERHVVKLPPVSRKPPPLDVLREVTEPMEERDTLAERHAAFEEE